MFVALRRQRQGQPVVLLHVLFHLLPLLWVEPLQLAPLPLAAAPGRRWLRAKSDAARRA
jgi:hypothetical protein